MKRITNIEQRGQKYVATISTCIDLGCDDPSRSARNRLMVSEQMNTDGYKAIERAVAHTPYGQSLPEWITKGNLPQWDSADYKQAGGDKTGLHLVSEEIVVMPDDDYLTFEQVADLLGGEPDLTDPTA